MAARVCVGHEPRIPEICFNLVCEGAREEFQFEAEHCNYVTPFRAPEDVFASIFEICALSLGERPIPFEAVVDRISPLYR